ncbi:hypothetical protein Afil01_03770 [Actinorhabdospora filicis]|uniref:Lipoprotein n=1 Tax=Actinorhabdospora filicis TaxID=1785913 RepID=A0A9W6SGH0_9ACTN|nr:hypothetical protein [Actinorhabdospora filicis]GLZ75570.1 hypothetical protein Afil01_03770 [Actinorhabdospora filicis]
MPPTTRKTSLRLSAAATLAAAALALSACSSTPPTLASPIGATEVVPAGSVTLEKTFDAAQTSLVGPHFALAVASAQFFPEITAAKAKELGLDKPLSPPPGYEVLAFTISPDFKVDPALSDEDPEAKIVTGGKEVALGQVPGPGDLVVALVQKDQPAELVITDAGRPFSVNLRDGSRKDFNDALLKAGATGFGNADDYDAEVEMRSGNWIITIPYYARFEVTKSAWLPGHDWAPDGKLWVQVDFTSQFLWKGDKFDVEWNLDPAASIQLKAGDTLKPAKSETGTKSGQAVTYTAVFEVAPDAESIEIVFRPSGDLKVNEGGKSSKASVTKDAKEKTIKVDFGG